MWIFLMKPITKKIDYPLSLDIYDRNNVNNLPFFGGRVRGGIGYLMVDYINIKREESNGCRQTSPPM